MSDQRSWQERWGVAELDVHHWLGFVGIAFLALSPFLALVKETAGMLAFGVGLLAFFWAVLITPDEPHSGESEQ